MLNAWLMSSVVVVLIFVAWVYWMYKGRPASVGGILGLLICAVAALAAYDGTMLAVREYGHAHNGRVIAGVVVAKLSSAGADGSQRMRRPRRRRSRPIPTTEGFKVHDVLARLILTGSPSAWIVEYRYPCNGPTACRGRDFVPESLWRSLYVGQAINVRRSTDGTGSSRLDENPQWKAATADLAIAGALLLVAGLVSGRLPRRRRPRYLTAPAVVTAIEPVKYRDVTRWRVRFAYYDPQGAAQESADEVQTDAWKPGDDCLAVFAPERPDLASLRPLDA